MNTKVVPFLKPKMSGYVLARYSRRRRTGSPFPSRTAASSPVRIPHHQPRSSGAAETHECIGIGAVNRKCASGCWRLREMLPRDGISIAQFLTVADIERSARYYEKVFDSSS